ncbi:MAG: ABC transporter substrate-binding protein [Actinomycetales bacterium]
MTSARSRRPTAALVAALAAVALAACGGDGASGGSDDARDPADPSLRSVDAAPGAGGTFAFEHSAGVTQVPLDPQRIATTTDQNALLPLLELGITPVASAGLVADDGSQSFRRTEGFDTSGIEFLGAYGEPNFEAFAAADPDLIVGYEFDADHYDTWSDIAPTALVQIFGRPLSDALVDFGTLVGREERAAELRGDYEARIAELSAALEPVRHDLSVSVITSGDPGQFWRADDGQAIGTVMADLDLPRPEPQSTGYFTSQDEPFSVETVADHDADVVLVVDFRGDGQDPGFDALVGSPLYQQLAASEADQAYVVDGTLTVGAAWARMDAFLDELEAILLAEDLDTTVVDEAAAR